MTQTPPSPDVPAVTSPQPCGASCQLVISDPVGAPTRCRGGFDRMPPGAVGARHRHLSRGSQRRSAPHAAGRRVGFVSLGTNAGEPGLESAASENRDVRSDVPRGSAPVAAEARAARRQRPPAASRPAGSCRFAGRSARRSAAATAADEAATSGRCPLAARPAVLSPAASPGIVAGRTRAGDALRALSVPVRRDRLALFTEVGPLGRRDGPRKDDAGDHRHPAVDAQCPGAARAPGLSQTADSQLAA